MALSFGRPKKDAEAPAAAAPVALNEHVRSELTALGSKGVTAALEVTDRAHGGVARLFLFDGGLYSVQVEAYQPHVGARLVASGAITSESLRDLGDSDAADMGARAARAGLIEVESLATVHQEYLLAALGAVLACPKVRIKVHKGEVTDLLCTLPLPIAPLFETVERRQERTSATWAAVDETHSPAVVALRRTGSDVPAALGLPEYAALAAAADPGRSLDAVAGDLGLTRAEAVHLAAMLVRARVLEPVADPVAQATGPLTVPEAFGTVKAVVPKRGAHAPAAAAVAVATTVSASAVLDEPEPEGFVAPVVPVAEAPEPEGESESAPEPEPEAPVEPVTETEPETEPVPAPKPAAPVAPVVVPDHVRQLRREVTQTEVAELEEALREAAAAEREAIAQTAAIRARLKEAQAALAELDDVGESTQGGDPPA